MKISPKLSLLFYKRSCIFLLIWYRLLILFVWFGESKIYKCTRIKRYPLCACMNISSYLHKSMDALVSVLFPYHCCLCHHYTGILPLCLKCWSAVVFIVPPFCSLCSKPFYNPVLLDCEEILKCDECEQRALYFKKCRSLAIYQDEFKNIIQQFKFYDQPYIGKFLGTKLAEFIKTDPDYMNSDLIIPVPLQKKREKERGYNQSFIIAQTLSKGILIPISARYLKRLGNHPPQSNLTMKERKLNVRGTFFVTNPLQIKGKTIILVDDVFTTGSTLNECARVLRHAGALQVLAITLARTS